MGQSGSREVSRKWLEVPAMLYGTAWKGERTSDLVVQAIMARFRGVDMAVQPRHYREDLVGDGLRKAFLQGCVTRGDIYLQTKFTWASGQDAENIPYDLKASISTQVRTSIDALLYALRSKQSNESASDLYLDCLLLHFPLPTLEEAWKAMEAYVPHKIRSLGVCNTSLLVLHVLCNVEAIQIRPTVVQNRMREDIATTLKSKEPRPSDSEEGAFWTSAMSRLYAFLGEGTQ
ncbi:hypothetical protein B7494_g6404 [Chlorociboria aeruginascens]|nr:hypothetical protein B7494_g6404 [Chlorociboria aeruginascens]